MRERLAAAVLLALLAGCSPAQPTPSVPGTVAPTPGQSVAAAPAEIDSLIPDNPVAVTVGELVLRVEPSLTASPVGTLKRGDLVRLMSLGPVQAEGAYWYFVTQIPAAAPGRLPALPAVQVVDELALSGWTTVASGATMTVARLPPRCPVVRDFANVAAMFPGERLACFGPGPITLDGSFGCIGCGGEDAGTYEPPWLAGNAAGLLTDPAVPAALPLQFPPSVVVPEEDTFMRIVGHLDDPRSTTCSITGTDPLPPPEVVLQLCRQHFVVDSFVVRSVEEIPPPE